MAMFRGSDRSDERLGQIVHDIAQPLTGGPTDYGALLGEIGEASFVLLGEASHGTHEFYRERAEITKRLIAERGFSGVAVEADWPDAYRVNCYVRGADGDPDAGAALGGFRRFPTWMWRNTVVRDFVEWLREHNCGQPSDASKVGFYGLDLYSLYGSLEAVIHYLDKIDPRAARVARERYACFEHFGESSQAYGYSAGLGDESCEQAVVEQLVDLQRKAAEYARRDGRLAEDEYFYAEQNARLAVNAEEYYRSMYRGRVSSWNLRDCHMAETLDELVRHLERHGGPVKVAVWAHNSHLGDARTTEMGRRGELNLGQLVRQRRGRRAFLVGFSTYTGTVTAAHDWDEPGLPRQVRPGLPGSYEELFHRVSAGAGRDPLPRFWLNLRRAGEAVDALRAERLQRAIGVVYRPETERWSHYFNTRLPDQFDALLHFDQTRALEPLDRTEAWDRREAPETYPSDDVPVGSLAGGPDR